MKLETLSSFAYHNIIEKSKLEVESTGVIEYIGRKLAEMRRIDEEYRAAYRRCFEGTPKEVARKLGTWDYVHEITRPRSQTYPF